jgi:hypothetical protein
MYYATAAYKTRPRVPNAQEGADVKKHVSDVVVTASSCNHSLKVCYALMDEEGEFMATASHDKRAPYRAVTLLTPDMEQAAH